MSERLGPGEALISVNLPILQDRQVNQEFQNLSLMAA